MPGSISSANYLAASAMHSFGSQIFSGAFTAPDPDVLTAITNVVSISFNGATFTPVEVSHLFSPDKFKEFIPGFGDAGEIGLTFNWSAALHTALAALVPLATEMPATGHGRRRLVISSPAQDTIVFRGFFNYPGFMAQLDAKIELPTLNFRTSGKPSYTAST